MDPEVLDTARALLRGARGVVALTGAGVSTASGIPDFRGPGGLWTRFDPEEFTYQRLLADPAGFWARRADLARALRLDEAKPNPAHEALAAAVHGGRVDAILTQNVDGLHQLAGAPEERVLELHGTGRRVRCQRCAAALPYHEALRQVAAGALPPRCGPPCGGVLKPDVVLFGEPVPRALFARAGALAAQAGAMLVAGSSLQVWPAAELPRHTLAAGGVLVVVNDAPTPLDARAHAVLRGRAEVVLPQLLG